MIRHSSVVKFITATAIMPVQHPWSECFLRVPQTSWVAIQVIVRALYVPGYRTGESARAHDDRIKPANRASKIIVGRWVQSGCRVIHALAE